MGARTSTRGFTFIELVVVIFLMSAIWLAALTVFESSDSMVQDARVRLRAEAQHRRDLQALTNYLREADISTLAGFDLDGIAVEPSIARVTGADLWDRTYGPTETLRWVAYEQAVDGLGNGGEIQAVTAGGSEVLCDRVLQNGFNIEQQGRNLVLNLTTYYRTDRGRVTTVTGSTVVALRNVE